MMIQSPLVKIKSSNEITRYDSVEHFDLRKYFSFKFIL